MQDFSYEKLRKALSEKRFEAYRNDERDLDKLLLENYLLNMRLSEALYPVLSALEVVLRNQIHHALVMKTDSEAWYDSKPQILHIKEQQEVEKAKSYLEKRKKELEPGRLVAELSFGFWTSLFSAHYERKLWPELIKEVFPLSPRRFRERKKLSKRLNDFRLLRNRVFHYEPIWHWPNLEQRHCEMLETIGWMSPEVAEVLKQVSRFESVSRQ